MKRKILIQLLLLISISNVIYGQISQGGLPYSLKKDTILNSSTYTLSNQLSINNKSTHTKYDTIDNGIVTTDERDIGEIFNVAITPEQYGEWTVTEKGDSIWQLQINAIN